MSAPIKERSEITISSSDISEPASLATLNKELSEYTHREGSAAFTEYYPGTERPDYDYVAERHANPLATNILESTSHLIKGCLGAGVLGIHEGFMYGGIWVSLVGTILIGVSVGYTMYLLVKCAQKLYVRIRVPRLSYPDVAEAALATGPLKRFRRYSKLFRYTVDTCIVVEMCGTCCIYQIMIASTLKQVLEAVSEGANEAKLSLRSYILIVMLPLLILTLIRNLKYLAPFSIFADVLVAICVITTIYYSLSKAEHLSMRPAFKSIFGFFQFSGICLFSMDSIPVILPIENNMKSPQYIILVVQYGMAVVIVAVSMTGFFGYWGWGEHCRSPITMHMPIETIPIILQILLVAMLAITFAVQFWVHFRIIWHYIGKRYKNRRSIWERFYRTIDVVIITSISVAFSDLIKLMIFLGNFLLGFLTFIFPASIEIMVT